MATFTVMVFGPESLNYQWQKNGTNLVDGGNISGATNSMLNIANLSDADTAIYNLVVSDATGSVTTSNAVLTVNDSLFIATQPLSQTVVVGSNVTFTAKAYGAPPFIFQWYYSNSPAGSPTSGTNVSAYTLTNVHTNQSGNYSVQVINGLGNVTSSNATLTVVSPPVITAQPSSRTNNAASTATFSVVASDVSALSYQWQKNGTNLANGGKISGATNSTLTITSVSDNEAAIYSVTVTNLTGSVTSSNATLTVIDPPGITTQPSGQRILWGGSVSFTVSVNGTAPLHYQWRFNSANILNATNAIYAIQVVGTNNAGNYSVMITNSAGSVTSSNALLTVLVRPVLNLQFSGGYPLLNLNGMLSNNFVVQYNTNLAGTNWINLLSLTNLSASPYLFLDPAGVVPPARFYRAIML
ncbi:MAG TPA: immunoglobulin domain-containing protein [Sedimentisphaerales bacterium]